MLQKDKNIYTTFKTLASNCVRNRNGKTAGFIQGKTELLPSNTPMRVLIKLPTTHAKTPNNSIHNRVFKFGFFFGSF